MFSNLNKPAFGAATTTPSFGFGGTAAPNQSPFGQSQLFGKPTPSGFGTPAPLFGATPQQPAPSLFGTPANTFGVTSQQTNFGSSGLFGQQQNVGTGNTLFGSTGTSTFGQQNKPTAFGFGSPAAPLFGQQQTQAFQPSTSAGLFGASTAFGAATQTGTVIKFNPVTGTDTMAKSGITHSISTKHHCITCMKEYDTKSLEELRWEDYQSNRKGPQQQGNFGTFATPASTAPSLFGGTVTENKSAFGQMNTFVPSSSSGFGLTSQANQPSIFGKPSTAFGTPTTNTFGFNTNTPGFGNTATVKPFGTTSTQNMFGTATTQSTGFGTSLFGQPNPQTSTTGFFNKPAQAAPFSTQQQPMFNFGQPPATTQSSFFQQPKPTAGFGTFGQTNLATSTGFAQPSLFSQPTAQNPFNTFAKPTQPLFGAQPQPTFGLGTQQPSGTNLFANANKPLFSNTTPNNLFASSSGFMMPQQQPMGLSTNTDSQLDFHTVVEKIYEPFPRYSFLDDLDLSKPACHNTTNPLALKEIMDNPMLPISPTNDISKLRVLHNSKTTSVKNPKYAMLEGLQDKSTTSNWRGKRLNLSKPTLEESQLPSALPEVITNRHNSDSQNASWFNSELANRSSIVLSPDTAKENAVIKDSKINLSKENVNELESSSRLYPTLPTIDTDAEVETPRFSATRIIPRRRSSGNSNIPTILEQPEQQEVYSTPTRQEFTSPRAVRFDDDSETKSVTDLTDVMEQEGTIADTCGIKLERTEYYTLPPLQDIKKFKNELGACIIKGFTIGRVGYGNIYFPDPMDVANLNLDDIVHIRYREVIVYTDDNNKPPIGEGLNRPAQVTIDRVWPRDPETKQMIKDASEIIKNNFVERLATVSEKQNAKFVDYRPETGSWVFTVDHFSKYKYIEDADEEAAGDAEKSYQNMEIRRAEEKKQLEMQQPVEEMPLEPIKLGLGGVHHPERLEESFSFIRPLSKPHHMTESKSVVIMKSTFFDEDSVSDDVSSSELAMQHFDIPTIQEVTLRQPRKPRIEKPRQYALHSFAQTVPIEHSLSVLSNYMDMQVFKGRSFKVGWGRGFTLMALPGAGGISAARDSNISSNVLLQLEVNCINDETVLIDFESHMKAVLSQTNINIDEIDVPSCSIKEGSKCLESFKDISDDNGICYKDVWELCLAFWGPNATTPTERNELFNAWLENVSAPAVAANLEPQAHSKSATLKNIYQYLTGHQIEAASNLAMEAGFPRLAVLIAACSNNTSRTLMYNQLYIWKENGTLKYIHNDLIKIYMLLGGIPVTGDVNVCESLDWKRSLAIHYWYICPPGILLTASLLAYHDAFSSTGYACRPSPDYYQSTDDTTNDVLYNIMLLFKSGNSPLYNVLNPGTYSENPLDFRLSWFLLQVFSSLKVGTISEQVYNFICISYASQLEHLGLWQWAVFVLLFIKDRSVKCNTIMRILDRNVKSARNNTNTTIEDFLVNDIKISPHWIHSVLAQKTALSNNHLESFQHLILANDYSKAHATAVSYLIPKFIKTRQLDILTKLLKDLLPGRATIWHWNTQAGFILDFLEVYHKITNFKDELSDFECRNIKSALSSLCLRMKEFPLETPHQSKALAKIGQFIAELVTIVYCDIERDAKNKKMASDLIQTLVMPYDYIHNELEKLSNKYSRNLVDVVSGNV